MYLHRLYCNINSKDTLNNNKEYENIVRQKIAQFPNYTNIFGYFCTDKFSYYSNACHYSHYSLFLPL